MSKPATSRAARRTTRPRPCCAPSASARASSTSWPQLIRGKKAAVGRQRAHLLASSASRSDVKKVLQSAIANAENNHQLDVDRLVVAEASVGKSLVMKRFHARGRGRARGIVKPFSNLTIVVRERAEAEDNVMGQKVNPIGLRLGINRTWDFALVRRRRDYAKLLHEDLKHPQVSARAAGARPASPGSSSSVRPRRRASPSTPPVRAW